jgi:hypothetical protein
MINRLIFPVALAVYLNMTRLCAERIFDHLRPYAAFKTVHYGTEKNRKEHRRNGDQCPTPVPPYIPPSHFKSYHRKHKKQNNERLITE